MVPETAVWRRRGSERGCCGGGGGHARVGEGCGSDRIPVCCANRFPVAGSRLLPQPPGIAKPPERSHKESDFRDASENLLPWSLCKCIVLLRQTPKTHSEDQGSGLGVQEGRSHKDSFPAKTSLEDEFPQDKSPENKFPEDVS